MHIVWFYVPYLMAEKRNFLLLAMGLGAAGVVIGAVTIWNVASDVLGP